jgi:hypothetical protein
MNTNFLKLNNYRKHYDYCYNVCDKFRFIFPFSFLFAIIFFVIVSFYKEVIHDLLLKKGTPDWLDVYANWLGCWDAVNFRYRL